MIVPSEPGFDFTPTTPPFITVGQEIQFQFETVGEVTAIVADGVGGIWIWEIGDESYALLDTGDPSQGTVFKRQPKPEQGTLFTAADGSRWVYPALSHGLYRCWEPGTVHGEGLANGADIEGLVAD